MPHRRSTRQTQHPSLPTQADIESNNSDGEGDSYQPAEESDVSSEDDEEAEPDLTQDKKGKGHTVQRKKTAMRKTKNTQLPSFAAPNQNQDWLDRLTADAKRLSTHNYHLISVDWTDKYIDQLLAHRKEIINTRPPSDVYAEAEIHQARYRRTKKLLSLIGHCTPMSMDAALWVYFSVTIINGFQLTVLWVP